MTDNERLAKWQEWEEYHSDINKHVPDYLNDDDAAMSLLDTLVEKGYQPALSYEAYVSDKWSCRVWQPRPNAGWMHANTRHEAVVAACLELIRKEDV